VSYNKHSAVKTESCGMHQNRLLYWSLPLVQQ